MQAGYKAHQVQVTGRFDDYSRISDEADRKEHVFHFCPECGSQVFYTEPTEPDLVVVSVGSFADPSFPPPTKSGYDSRRHPWVQLPDSVSAPRPRALGSGATSLRGRQLRRGCRQGPRARRRPSRPGVPPLQHGLLRESRRPRRPTPSSTFAGAADMWEGCLEMAKNDSDFDAIRDEPPFQELVGR